MSARLVLADRIIEGFSPDGAPIIHEDAALLIEAGKVAGIGAASALKAAHPQAKTLGGRGKVVMPGMINAHHHVGLTPFQLGSPDYPLELWFASRMALRDVDLRLDTLFSAFEMVASGVTTVQHLHSRAPVGRRRCWVPPQGDRRLSRDRHARLLFDGAPRPEPAGLSG